MKRLFFNRVLVFVSILFLCTNCTNKENLGENVNPKKIEDAFYNPKVNTFDNEERKIVFNSDLLTTEEMNFIKNGIAKNILNKDFNKLAESLCIMIMQFLINM